MLRSSLATFISLGTVAGHAAQSIEGAITAAVADPHTADPFDPSIRGRTGQFITKFTRPNS